MASDDLVYGLLLFLSIPFGLVIRSISSPILKEIVCTLSGVSLIIITCREHGLHSVIVTAVNTVVIYFAKENRYLHVYSFVWCFSYLAFFRTCHWYGVPQPSPPSNAVQLLLTLRLVSLATEIYETEKLKRQVAALEESHPDYQQLSLRVKYKSLEYSWTRLISYSYCYIGALTGPFFTCRTYQDMLNRSDAPQLPLWEDFKHRLKPLPVCAVLFLGLTATISIQQAKEDVFYDDTSLLYRWVYVCVLWFIWFRVRFYSAWTLAECMCVTAGLGAYPKVANNKPGGGPSDLQALDEIQSGNTSEIQYDFNTITNILPYETDFAVTIRSSIRTWNMTVQWWLAVHVYKNIPIQNKTLRGTILMIISAYWHGVHPGWYATFLSAPFLLLAEDGMRCGIRDRLSSPSSQQYYDNIASFMRMRFFEYYAVGAFFLSFDHIWRYWSSIYFFGHYLLVAIIVVGQLLSFLPNRKSESQTS